MKKVIRGLLTCVFVIAIAFFAGKYIGGWISNLFPIVEPNLDESTSSENTEHVQPTFDALLYPYYDMLDENQKIAYGELYESLAARKESVGISATMDMDDLEKVFISITSDHPELFYVDNNYQYEYVEDTGKITRVIPNYNEYVESYEEHRENFESTITNLVNIAQQYSSQYDQEKIVHDTLIDLIQYDVGSTNNQSAYSGLVNHETVCAGFAKSFQVVMQRLGIPCYYVMGTSVGEEHAWNIVNLDGVFYNVDITWDNSGEETDSYYFFNLDDSLFDEYHERSTISYGLPKCVDSSLAHLEDADVYDKIIFRLP